MYDDAEVDIRRFSREQAAEFADALGGDASIESVQRALKECGVVFPGTEFVGAAESAEELGVKGPNVRRTPGLPDPFGQVRSGPFWIAVEIRALKRRRDRERAREPS